MEKENDLGWTERWKQKKSLEGMLPFGFAVDRRHFHSIAAFHNNVLHIKI
jgi:hypothetical protein